MAAMYQAQAKRADKIAVETVGMRQMRSAREVFQNRQHSLDVGLHVFGMSGSCCQHVSRRHERLVRLKRCAQKTRKSTGDSVSEWHVRLNAFGCLP